MNTYQIWIEENGKLYYYGKTPLSAQAYSIKYRLETEQNKKVKIRYNGQWR